MKSKTTPIGTGESSPAPDGFASFEALMEAAIEAMAHAKIDLRDAEIRRLREALKTIANWQGGLGVEWPMDIARRALSANGALTGNRREEQG